MAVIAKLSDGRTVQYRNIGRPEHWATMRVFTSELLLVQVVDNATNHTEEWLAVGGGKLNQSIAELKDWYSQHQLELKQFQLRIWTLYWDTKSGEGWIHEDN